jgi:hypothetical protein
MALQLTVTTPHGFEASGAYHRVENIRLTSKNSIEFEFRSYKNAELNAAFASKLFFCAYDLSAGNPFMQAYTYLKTLPEFANAADC